LSDVCSSIVAVVPLEPPVLKTVPSRTNEKNVTLDLSDWDDTYNGGSSIISFEIQMQLNDGEFRTLVGAIRPFIANSYVLGVDKGNWYGFRYRAKNIYGWGPFTSTVLKVLAATTPAAPAVPIVTHVDSTQI